MSSQRRTARNDEADESAFASVTADYILRKGNANTLAPAAPDDGSAEDGFLVRKGHAAPAPRATGEAHGDLARLNEELAAVRALLAKRDAAFTAAELEFERIYAEWMRESEESLRNAEQSWKANAAAQFAAAETQWRDASTKALTNLQAQNEATQKRSEEELRRMRAELDTLRASTAERERMVSANSDGAAKLAQTHEAELAKLRETRAALQAIVANRDAELTKLRTSTEQAREAWRKESQETLAKAESAWKTQEAAHVAAAQSQGQESSTKALAAMQAELQAAQDRNNRELRRLKDECASAIQARTNSDAELGKLRSELEQTKKQAEAAEAKAAKPQTAAEAPRGPSQADAAWKKLMVGELAEARTRYEAAETALAQMRAQAARERNQTAGPASPFAAEDIATLRAKLSHTEAELAKLRSGQAGISIGGSEDGKIVIRPNGMRDVVRNLNQEKEKPAPAPKLALVRDVFAASLLAIAFFAMLPWIAPILPDSWRPSVAAVTGSTDSKSVAATDARPMTAEESAARFMAGVSRDVNLRADPSTTAAVISTLARGEHVAVIGQRGAWTHIRKGESLQGWVASTFLTADKGTGETP